MSNENSTSENEPEDLFESVTVCSKTAKCFLRELDEIHERWGEGTWVFRGQNDAKWDPIPSLFRDWDHKSIEYEFKLISMFVRHINMVDLPVPADTIGFKTYTRSRVPTTFASLSHSSGYGYKYDYTRAVLRLRSIQVYQQGFWIFLIIRLLPHSLQHTIETKPKNLSILWTGSKSISTTSLINIKNRKRPCYLR